MQGITGLMIYYYFVCKRKLWYFINEIGMEQNSELVSMGKVLDETSFSREKKHVMIDNTINVDFIKNKAILNEVKKTKSIEEAGIWQVKYYMFYLEENGVKNIQAKIDYPLLKETKEVFLEEDDREILKNVIQDIQEIRLMEKPLEVKNESMCKNCAYYDLCYV